MNTVAIIPARGGSKRIPNKNIRSFCGKPIIYYSIMAARETGLFDEVIVSTDDETIAEIASNFGASVNGLRPAHISDDQTGVMTVVSYELEVLNAQGLNPQQFCLIYATAPLIRTRDLVASHDLLFSSGKDFVFSAAEYSSSIFRAFTILPNGGAKMFQPEFFETNSQDLPKAYFDAGQFCWGQREAILASISGIFTERSAPFILPANRAIDIDTLDDWDFAEWMYLAHQSNSTST